MIGMPGEHMMAANRTLLMFALLDKPAMVEEEIQRMNEEREHHRTQDKGAAPEPPQRFMQDVS